MLPKIEQKATKSARKAFFRTSLKNKGRAEKSGLPTDNLAILLFSMEAGKRAGGDVQPGARDARAP
ncbi:hypothetical protein AW736_13000 [Termitidicoccus mucosus]|uniref:Uncharacterized protein n=1 Tax=Termitidicoccus mucosus TaxID=1184151 RepID=A0A178IHN4_9BACT|nr:hypothetical protein AW736_13000 [Opitutaceae bacterium TSB47]